MTITDAQIAKIADHAFDREDRVYRFNDDRYGAPLGVDTPEDLAAVIKAAVLSEAASYAERAEGGYLLRDSTTNITVAVDGLGAGTAYRDKRFEGDFARLIRQEDKLRSELGLEPATLCDGAAPYTEREQENTQAARDDLLADYEEQIAQNPNERDKSHDHDMSDDD